MNQYTTQGPPKPLRKFLGVTQTSVTPVPLPLWPLREWQRQAAILYPGNAQRQRQALAEHLEIAMSLTSSPTRWLWLAKMSSRLAEEAR